MSIARWRTMSFALSGSALLAVVMSHLALTDISHGEGDLSLEWMALRVCFFVIVLSQVVGMIALNKVAGRTAP